MSPEASGRRGRRMYGAKSKSEVWSNALRVLPLVPVFALLFAVPLGVLYCGFRGLEHYVGTIWAAVICCIAVFLSGSREITRFSWLLVALAAIPGAIYSLGWPPIIAFAVFLPVAFTAFSIHQRAREIEHARGSTEPY